MLSSLYRKLLALSGRRRAPYWLAAVSFAESSFLPIAPDLLLVPMVLARRDRAWWLATICTAASVAGGLLGYLIGYGLFDVLARPLLHAYDYEGAFARFQDTFAAWGVWIILLKGLTPIPFKIVTLASGAAHFNLPLFLAATAVTRGARFFLLAGLLRRYGAPVAVFIERRPTLIATATVIAAVAGFASLRLF
jgi:membrane protein YqaA with SNARE-associated domain